MRIIFGIVALAAIALSAAFLRPMVWFFVALLVGLALVGLAIGTGREASETTSPGDSGFG